MFNRRMAGLTFVLLFIAQTVVLLVLHRLQLLAAGGLWAIPVLCLVTYGVARWWLRPLGELATVAKRLSAGDLHARPALRMPPYADDITRALMDMARNLEINTRHFDREVRERTAELNRKASQLRALGQVGQQVAAVLEPAQLLHFVVSLVRGTFGYDVVAIVREEGGHFVLAACAARDAVEVPLGRVFASDERSLRASWEGDGELSDDPVSIVEKLTARVQLTVPLRIGERTMGVIVVQSKKPHTLDDDDMFTVRTIAGQVAVALENARLFAAERQLRQLAITDERQRLSREIHDTLAQGFMGVLMHLRAMQGAADGAVATMHREQAEELAQLSLKEARRSVWNLHPERLARSGLAEALADEAQRLRLGAGLQVTCSVTGDADAVPPLAAAGLLRIAQESLHNVLRHAHAQNVTLHLAVAADGVVLTITDDGVGFEPAFISPVKQGGAGYGLASMRERARLLGGALTVESVPGEGTTVTVRVPEGVDTSRGGQN